MIPFQPSSKTEGGGGGRGDGIVASCRSVQFTVTAVSVPVAVDVAIAIPVAVAVAVTLPAYRPIILLHFIAFFPPRLFLTPDHHEEPLKLLVLFVHRMGVTLHQLGLFPSPNY